MDLNCFHTCVYAKMIGAIKKNKLYPCSWKAEKQMFTECFQEHACKNHWLANFLLKMEFQNV